MNLLAIFITKRLNISSAGKLSEHDSGTEGWGQYFRSGLGCLKKDTLFYLSSQEIKCSAYRTASTVGAPRITPAISISAEQA